MTETFDIGNIPPQLRESMLHGKGAADIGWGRDGDFNSCLRFLEEHGVPRKFWHGECAELHKEATGFWPGKGRSHSHSLEELQALVASMGDYKPIKWSGPLAPIGSPTGDGRLFPPGIMQYQTFPQPLRWQEIASRGHDGAVTVGVIEHASEKEVDGKPWIWGHGYFLDPDIIPEVKKALHQVEHGVTGPSVDLDSYTAALSMHGQDKVASLRRGRQRAATLVAIPAFADLRLKLEHPDAAIVASAESFAVNPVGWRTAKIAPREALFDADDAVSRIESWANGDPAKMASAFLWVNSENGPLLGREGYRLPWGDIVDGEPFVIFHAIYAAAALLEGAHGGLPNIPDADKQKLRSIITEIYKKLAVEYDDPSMHAPWENPTATAALEGAEEFLGHYTEKKHPRDPRHDKHAGEWVDVPLHGPHGQIKVGGKWVYPDHDTGKLPHQEHHEAHKKAAKATVRKAAPKKPEPEHKAPEKKAPAKAAVKKAAPAKKAAPQSEPNVKEMSDQTLRAHITKMEAEEQRALNYATAAKKGQRKSEHQREMENYHKASQQVDAAKAELNRRRDERKATPAKKAPAKVTVTKKEHKLTEAQHKALRVLHGHGGEGEKAHPAAVKVLEREGHVTKHGDKHVLTPKGHAALSEHHRTGEEKKVSKVTVRKTSGHKLTEAQTRALKSIHSGEGKPHPASVKVLEREGYLSGGKLTSKGHDALGHEQVGAPQQPKKVAKVAVRKAPPKTERLTAAQNQAALQGAKTHEEQNQILEGLSRQELVDLAEHGGYPYPKGSNAATIRGHIKQVAGRRIDSKALFRGGGSSGPTATKAKKLTGQEHVAAIEKMDDGDQIAQYLEGLSRQDLVNIYEARGDQLPWSRANADKLRRDLIRSERIRLHTKKVKAEEARKAAEKLASLPKPSGPTFAPSSDIWWREIPVDTGPGGRLVNGVDMGNGYLIKHGTIVRKDGISYVVEHEPGENPYDIIKGFQDFHATLPPDAQEYQKAYAWLRGANPDDAYWQKKFNRPDMVSAASAGDGLTRVWNDGDRGRMYNPDHGPANMHSILRHEFGHNVSNALRDRGLDDSGQGWLRAGKIDVPREPVGWQQDYRKVGKTIVFGRDDKRAYPSGITEYGKSSPGEDYAESTSAYLAGVIGYQRQGDRRVPVYFRDIFPERAKVLDQVYPIFARRQLDQISAERRGLA